MNQQHHRIIFNRSRGQYMAVAETAKSQAKGSATAGGESRASRPLALGPLVLGCATAALTASLAQAQIVADPNAPGPQRPTVLAAPNGVPVVNIQTPSAAGVSRNTYSQFDVGGQGAILNNSRGNVQSQLGGWVQGNPWLAKGPARIILNEVNSANPSQIKGYVEIAGQRAELVIANPAGINIEGGGFINASRAILTTGTPQLGQGGSLDGYRVERGTITIGGKGLDASLTDYTGILARAAQLNAGVWAKDLAVITGQNTVAASGGQAGRADIQATGQGAPGQPQFALDVSKLGGMYAGKIVLIGTEAGVGVRNAGAIGASAGQVSLSADGLLTNSGTLGATAAGQHVVIDTHGRGLANSGTIASQADVRISDSGALRNSGTINAARELHARATDLDNSQGTLEAARLDIGAGNLTNTSGKISQSGSQQLSVNAQTLSNTTHDGQSGVLGAQPVPPGTGTGGTPGQPGTGATPATPASPTTAPSTSTGGAATRPVPGVAAPLAAGQIAIASHLDNAGGQIVANGATDLTVTQRLTNSGTVQVRALDVQGKLDNSGGRLNAQTLQNNLDQLSNRDGKMAIQSDLQLHARHLDNTRGQITTTGNLVATVQQGIVNQAATLAAEGDVTLTSLTLDNSAIGDKGGRISSNSGKLTVQAGESISNRGGSIQTASTAADKTLTLSTGVLDNTGGQLRQSGAGTMTVNASQRLLNGQGGAVSSQGALTLNAGAVNNVDGGITARRGLTARTGEFDNSQGQLLAQETLTLQGTGALINTGGQIGANQALSLASASTINDQKGRIHSSTGDVRLNTGALNNQGGAITAAKGATLSTQALDNTQGQIRGATLSINTQRQALTNRQGKLTAGSGAIDIASGALHNQGGAVQAATTLTLNTHNQALGNTQGGQISAAGHATLTTGALDNSGGRIQAGGTVAATASAPARTVLSDVTIQAGGPIKNAQGAVQASRDIAVVAASSIDNSQGQLLAGQALRVQGAQAVVNTGGKLQANEQVRITSASLSNDQRGQISSARDSVTVDTGALNNQGGLITAQTATRVGSRSLDNTAGQIIGSTLHIDTHQQSLNNQRGKLVSGTGVLDIQSGALNNEGGLVQAKQNLNIDTHGQTLANTHNLDDGGLLAGGDLQLKAGGWVNQSGRAQATGALQAQAASLDNSAGKVLSARTLTLATTGDATNTNGQITAAEAVRLNTGSLRNDAKGRIGSVTDAVTVQTGDFDNQNGTVAAKTDIAITSQALNNSRGTISGGTLAIDTQRQSLRNDAGQLVASAGALGIQAGAISNQDGAAVFASGPLHVTASAGLHNQRGSLSSHGDARIDVTGAIDNTAGLLQAGKNKVGTLNVRGTGAIDNRAGGHIGSQGELTLASGAALHNQGGSVAGNGAAVVQAAGVNNAGGKLSADALVLQSRDAAGQWQAVDNQGGSIAARQHLSIDSGRLDNSQAGTITTVQAGGALVLRTHGQDIVNRQSGDKGGLLAAGSLHADAQGGQIDNASGGYIGAKGPLDLHAARILNQSGTITADQHIGLKTTAASGTGLDNGGGAVHAKDSNLTITAGAADIDNRAGRLTAGGNLSATTTGALHNQQGQMTAGQTLAVTDSAAITNTGGTLHAGQLLALRNTTVTGDGKLLSDRDLELALRGSYTLGAGGELSANGQLTLSSQGDIVNQGQILGGSGVSVSASNIDNQAGASITSHGKTTVTASNTLTNRGLIDGAHTEVGAATLNNTGTGRIYGDQVSVRAGTLHNQADTSTGVRQSATIAARQRLDIGAHTVHNTAGATLLSLGQLNISGALDGQGQASAVQAGAIHNHGASIEALGGMHLNAANVNNTNAGLTINAQVPQGTQAQADMYAAPGGAPEEAKWFREVGDPDGALYRVVHPDRFGIHLPPAYKAPQQSCHFDGNCHTVPAYYEPRNSLRYQQHGVQPPPAQAVALPKPTDFGARIGFDIGVDGSGGGTYPIWVAGSNKAGYDAAMAAYRADQKAWHDAAIKLNQIITATNAENNRTTARLRDYTLLHGLTQTTYKDQVASTDPGRIRAGGGISVNGNLNNTDSSVIAGGAIQVAGGSANNAATDGTQRVTTTGLATDFHWRYSGIPKGDKQKKKPGKTTAYTHTATTTFKLDTLVYQPFANVTSTATVAGNTNGGQHVQALGSQGPGHGRQQHGALSTAASGAASQATQALLALNAPGASGPRPVAVGLPVDTASAGGTPPPLEVKLPGGSAQGPLIARTSPPAIQLPSSSLFTVHAGRGHAPLIETDPRFTSYRQWLSSDYMLRALDIDPARTHKRLGDGFYEQGLIRDQIGQLTGRRFAGDHRGDDEQYKALMDAGVTFARAHGIRPGIALAPQQIAQLTSDIVWLVERPVTLSDGTRQNVLVPQVYVVLRADDLQPTGALISGHNVQMTLTGDLSNSGTIAGRHIVNLGAQDLQNVGGRISAAAVGLHATRDIHVTGGAVEARDTLLAQAGRDIHLTTTTRSSAGGDAHNGYSHTGIDRVAGLYVTTSDGEPGSAALLVQAGRDIHLSGAQINNRNTNAATVIDAGQHLNIGAVNVGQQQNIRHDSRNHLNWSASGEIGSQLQSAGDTRLKAGSDLNVHASSVQAAGHLQASAGRNVNIESGSATETASSAYYSKRSGLLGSRSSTRRDDTASTSAIASSLGGQRVSIDAGHDLSIKGSEVIGDQGTTLSAGHDVRITAAATHTEQSHFSETKQSGLFGSGGMGITLGRKQQSTDTQSQASGSAASTVGAIDGHVSITAGNHYQQTGSRLTAPKGDIDVSAKRIDIEAERTSASSQSQQKFKQSGLSVSVGSPLINAAQTTVQLGQAMGNTGSARMQALGAAAAAANIYNNAGAIQGALTNPASSANLSISLGTSQSQSSQSQQSSGSDASTIAAGGNVRLKATGGGQDSNITITGSAIQAGGNATLVADNRIQLQAAQHGSEDSSRNNSSSASIGLGMGGVTLSASKGQGQGASQSLTHANSQLSAGNTLTLQSGGDTRLEGAVLAGQTVKADIGGDLIGQSLQGSSQYKANSKNVGGSLTVGPTGLTGASLSAGKTHIDSQYQSVGEQTAIRAGDGGFDIQVKGKTALTGAQITSTQKAVDEGNNRFESQGGITLQDMHNSARYQGSGVQVGVGISQGQGDGQGQHNLSRSVGFGSDKGQAQSTSTA
ncbi:MAG: hemagglutinin repeat-containing protein, partial [Pseudomonadota bacterium]|nr:hemagglutinin repeat-containing protein [Pseudomonadota bacterium]